MAINYLNTVNLNSNQLENAAIQNLATDPAAGVLGQVYYNTAISELKICTTAGSPTGAVWTIVGSYDYWVLDADGQGATANITNGMTADFVGGLKITTDSTSGGTLNIVHDTQAQTDTTSTAAPGYGGTFTAVDGVTRDSTGHVTGINVKTVTIPAAEDYTFSVTADSGTDQTIDSGNTLDIAGGTNITTVVGATDTVTVNLDDSIDLAGELTVSGTGQSSVAGQLTIPQTPSADTDAASKHYVDQAVTGALSYQGGYNASTNTPDLDTNSSIEVKKGWTYTVTADGLFFTEQVRVGDVLISEADQAAGASALTNWTTVQNNVDLADASTVGIGNVVPGSSNTVTAPYTNGTATLDVVDSTASQKGAVIVAASTDSNLEGIDVAYSSGTAAIGLDIQGLTGDDGTGDPISNFEIPFYSAPDDQNYKITIAQLVALASSNNTATGTITAGQLTGTVTHAFGVNTIVQTIDSSGNTVICDISRTATTSVATISAAQATDITILVQKVG